MMDVVGGGGGVFGLVVVVVVVVGYFCELAALTIADEEPAWSAVACSASH